MRIGDDKTTVTVGNECRIEVRSGDDKTTKTVCNECRIEVRSGVDKTTETVGNDCRIEVQSGDDKTTVTVRMSDSTADHRRWNGCRVIEVANFKWLQLLPRGSAAFD